MNERKRKNIIIMALCACITLMGIGYALLSQTLTINTTATISSTWDIRITNVEVASKVGYAIDTTPDNNIADDGHSATITANLSAPGDTITYTVTVHNFGTIAGMYDVATQNLITPGAGQPEGIVTATTDVATSNSLKYLAPQTGEGTFNVTLKFEDLDELPDVKEYSFTITPNFIQTSESGVTPGGDINEDGYSYKVYKSSESESNQYAIIITDSDNNSYISIYGEDADGNDITEKSGWQTGQTMPININNFSGEEKQIKVYETNDDLNAKTDNYELVNITNDFWVINGLDICFNEKYAFTRFFDKIYVEQETHKNAGWVSIIDNDFNVSKINFDFNS